MFIPIPMQVSGVPETRGRVPRANAVLVGINVLLFLLAAPEQLWVGPGTGLLSLLTYGFAHTGWRHLIFNLWALWLFGNPVNRRIGDGFYLAAYLGTLVLVGLAARLLSGTFLVGSSGGVFAVIAVALLLMPSARIQVHYLACFPLTVPLGLVRRPRYPLFWLLRWGRLRLRAAWCLLLVPLWEVIGWLALLPGGGSWSHAAHLLGLACGVAAVLWLPDRITRGRQVVYS